MARTYNPFYEAEPAVPLGRPRVRFSRTEVLHLLQAVVILSLAFSLFLEKNGRAIFVVPSGRTLLASFLAVSSGFVLHELAHKVVAQRYGFWAEFRAQMRNLLVALGIAIATPVLFAAPGAVLISGRVTPKENGVISLVGPGINFLIAAAMLPFTFASDPDADLPYIMGTIGGINALLAVFNLIPAGPLDGKKVWRWNKLVWVVAFLVSIALWATITFDLLTL